jgi:acyl carrier protein
MRHCRRAPYPLLGQAIITRRIGMLDIKAQVRAYILENFFMAEDAARRLQDGDSFIGQRIIDSTGFLELISFLEETFAMTVEDQEMVPENLDSLDNIESYIRRKRGL